ncbi:peptidoglycan/xylan/chitin deacetylase (PgdA/CDA1 family) [Nonomuraea muscovyensis]|uniref:Peptidoglycan/xylan/chitin deacetylase (PgdA/CDA1 family) n=1 Tax=Nonomuraea muscovyensis TaxID=1124761 RepID=A0A7X0F118_9ACTN|nr:polysaccharide deacetylase family protein [Nonomuraea muscovyensis]MBB6351498.1 peptidoglycan/xylan/chitin deacetylase (PgdA/CDA1 family) [Nonomuraea muscovyensis]
MNRPRNRGWPLVVPLAALLVVLLVGGACAPRPPSMPVSRPPQVVDLGLLARRLAAMQPGWPAPAPDCRRDRCVALTFDDGPGPHTGRLLDLLRARRARATFFVVGHMVAAGRAGLVRRIAQEGHELGNHTWSHAALTALPDDRLRRELLRTGDLVRRLTGVRMRVMRPPYGMTDGRVARETRRQGMAQILWDVDTRDWRDRDPADVTRRAARASPGSVVLMHDLHRATVRAMTGVLDRLSRRGYRFVTVSELAGGGRRASAAKR